MGSTAMDKKKDASSSRKSSSQKKLMLRVHIPILLLPGSIEKQSDYAKGFKWKEKDGKNYLPIEIRLLIALQESETAQR
ncbi:hypothetical protein WISP_122125 [Willisornis vidua]|uniref:Uncharacterized protein n=1 Tax=Willisornis vidua TaxID=1566151 RepID=A0ABQ9CY04_9PASS|nr:hypothetical protein WISP_122125 [Willisornis vidua]